MQKKEVETEDKAVYETFRHEVQVLVNRQRHVLQGEGRGLVVLGLLYTGLRDSDGTHFLLQLDKMAFTFAKQDQLISESLWEFTSDEERVEYERLRVEFITTMRRYKPMKWRSPTPGLSTALYLAVCMEYDTLQLPQFELDAMQLIPLHTSFASRADWMLWLYQGEACSRCYKTPPNVAALNLCGQCRRVYYCSRECQVEHRARHRSQCKLD
jgi:hypothetical protein